MYRDAERQLKSALRDQDVVDTYLYLCKVYRRLDQPLTATEVYKKVGLCPLITCLRFMESIDVIYQKTVSYHVINEFEKDVSSTSHGSKALLLSVCLCMAIPWSTNRHTDSFPLFFYQRVVFA